MYASIRVSEIYLSKTISPCRAGVIAAGTILDARLGIQEFIQSFLRGSRPLYHAGRPPDSAYGKRQHVYIHHKFCNGTGIYILDRATHIIRQS